MNSIYEFLLALQFLTRLPISKNLNKLTPAEVNTHLKNSIIYFPLVGFIVGVINFVLFYTFNLFWDLHLSLMLVFCFEVLITGAFHEDAVADFCDGFGGGWKKEQILEIMKDSRVGSYGSAGLILAFSLKYLALISTQNPGVALILASTISRWGILWMMFLTEPLPGLSKDINANCSGKNLFFTFMFTFLVLINFYNYKNLLILFFGVVVLLYFFVKYVTKRIGGFTGDCLGLGCYLSQIFVLLVLASKDGLSS